MPKSDDFQELVRDPKTGKLREGAVRDVPVTKPKSLGKRVWDRLTEPYAGTQGPGKEWAKGLQAQDESPVEKVGTKREVKFKDDGRGNGRAGNKPRGEYTK